MGTLKVRAKSLHQHSVSDVEVLYALKPGSCNLNTHLLLLFSMPTNADNTVLFAYALVCLLHHCCLITILVCFIALLMCKHDSRRYCMCIFLNILSIKKKIYNFLIKSNIFKNIFSPCMIHYKWISTSICLYKISLLYECQQNFFCLVFFFVWLQQDAVPWATTIANTQTK